MSFIKRLFCKHEKTTFVKNLGGDGAEYYNAQSIWKCDKCSKTLYLNYRNNGLINSMIKNRNISTGDISDGYHTFDELYNHRLVLFSIICNQDHTDAWKSKLHDDGTMFDDYFIVGIKTVKGQFTYHYHMDNWEMFDVFEYDTAPTWDGHTADDIIRLLELNDYKVRKPQFKKR